MKYYAQLLPVFSVTTIFEFETEELREGWIARENSRLEEDYNWKVNEHERLNCECKKYAERCNQKFIPEPYPGCKEYVVPITEQEALEKTTSIRRKIYSVDDKW